MLNSGVYGIFSKIDDNMTKKNKMIKNSVIMNPYTLNNLKDIE